MPQGVQVAILDDHQSVIDGYMFRLGINPRINIVATARFGQEIESLFAKSSIDVLILDVQVATSPENLQPYPILHVIPKLLQTHKNLAILVISMHNQPFLIKSVMDAGASGFILKDDLVAIKELGNIICAIAEGGIHLSQQAFQQLSKRLPKSPILSPRQLAVLSLCVAYPDATTAQLAAELEVAPSTARNLLSAAYLHLGVRNRASAIEKARRLGLITPYVSYESPASRGEEI